MDLYDSLNLKPVRSAPDVWVSRVVVYERIGPTPQVIRDVSLKRGVNIVWAEEPEDDKVASDIAGHSAGKTSFCRVLRYVLGETTFGTKANMEMIRKALPDAYVGGELWVKGTRWAVVRPIGGGRVSYAKSDVTLEDLLASRPHSVNQTEYPSMLGFPSLIDGLETGAVVRTGESIQWGHLLAWCARDQEARFQSIFEWRSPRSESEWPAFRFPRADPLFVMRAVLGLFLPDELKGEEELAERLRRQEVLTKELDELRREPQFRVNRYSAELRELLSGVFPERDDIDSLPPQTDTLNPDLRRVSEEALNKLRDQANTVDGERAQVQETIDSTGGSIQSIEVKIRTLESLFEVSHAAEREATVGLGELQHERDLVTDRSEELCPFGKVKLKDCVHVKERQVLIRPAIVQDAHAMEQLEARRADESARAKADLDTLRSELERARKERRELQLRRDGLGVEARGYRESAWQIERTRTQLMDWVGRTRETTAFVELDRCQDNLKAVTDEILHLRTQLSRLLTQHTENRKRLETIFSGLVKSVLPSATYDGQVALTDGELSFRILHGTAMSGEAVETLSVLLADIAGLVYHSVADRSRLPGFVIHDSPREADLGLRLYRRLLRLIAALESHFPAPDTCPFQYILTTTTPPPEEMRSDNLVRLRLDAAHPEGMLFKRNIALGPPGLFDGQLFDGSSSTSA
jgi:uncharacterized coiled-coil DUF342 family protein